MDSVKIEFVDSVLHGKPGVSKWFEDFGNLTFMCPCGCGAVAGINLKPVYPHGWDWDGNKELPTINPSIKISPCGWHGYLRAGVFESC